MQMVKIRFAESNQAAEGFVALAKRGRVMCFADETYEVPKKQLKILDELGIAYEVVREEGFDHACHALRNSSAA